MLCILTMVAQIIQSEFLGQKLDYLPTKIISMLPHSVLVNFKPRLRWHLQ
jgi:hypothetical protein